MEWESKQLGLLPEDGSLIQQQTPHSHKSPYHQPRISPATAKGINVRNDPASVKLNSLSHQDMTNKENITTNKLEGPKLSMEPMQMKKKKKGGGYNLRKSLAWNQAFFTEDGVLDPIELSMITGTLGNSSREALCAITEEATTSLSNDIQFNRDSANPCTPEKNLFKASPAACSGKDRGTVCLSLKHTSPAHIHQASTSVASHKVLSTHGARKTAARASSSPRSLPLSTSMKRPANINAQKAVSKESRLPKFPVSKPGHPSIPATNKRTIGGATSLKQNQMLQPVVNTQRNTELKSYSKSVKNTQSRAKAVSEELLNKSSASHAKRNKVNPRISLHASTQLCPIQVNKVHSSGSKLILDDVPSVITVDSSDSQDVTTQLAVRLPSSNVITGTTLQHTQSQSTKPSGLRMPSPSLGFFGQSKFPASSCFSHRIVDPSHRRGKLGDWRPPQLPAKIPGVVDGKMLTSRVSRSRFNLSAVSIDAITPDVGKDAMMDGKKIPHEPNHCELESDKNRLLSITDTNGKFKNHVKGESITAVDKDGEAEMKENINLLKIPSCRSMTEVGNAKSCTLGHTASTESAGNYFEHSLFYQPEEFAIGVTGTRNMNTNSCEDENSGSSTVNDVINGGVMNSASVRCMQNLDQSSSLQSDRLETSNFEELLVPDEDKPSMLVEGNHKKMVGDSWICGTEKIDNQTVEDLELTNSRLENLEFSSEHIYASLSKDSFVRNEMAENRQNLKQSLEVIELKDTSAMLLQTQTACPEFEQISKSIHGLASADCILLEKDIGSEKYKVAVNEMFPIDEKGAIEMDNSGVENAETFGGMEGEGFDTNQIISHDFLSEPNEMAENTQSLKQSLEVVELKDTSATLLQTQTACPEVEQISKCIHGLTSADCMLLEKGIGSEKYQVAVNEMFPIDEKGAIEMDNSGVEIAETFGGKEDEGFDTNQMIRHDFLSEPTLVSFEVAPLVPNHDSALDTSVTHVILSDRATSFDMHRCSSEASEFLVGEVHKSFHGDKVKNSEVNERNLVIVEPVCQSLFSGPHLESHVADNNHTSLYSESKVCHDDQKSDTQTIAGTDSTFDGYPGIEIAMQTREATIEATSGDNISQTGNDPEFFADSSVPTKCCIDHISVVGDHSATDANCTEESEQLLLSNCFTLVEEVSGLKNMLFPRDSSYEETTESAKSKESNVLGSGDAIVVEFEHCESEFRSYKELTDAPLRACDRGNHKFNGDLSIEETKPSCTEIEPSSEKCELSSGSQTRHYIELGGGLTSPRSVNQSIGVIDSALTDEIKPEVCQDMDSLVKDTKCDLKTSLCQEQDGNSTAAIGSNKAVSNSDKTNLIIFPPRNAVPFSDEWLAAVEAAGEEILTVKSGAVQNSPPDKCLPEPSPWSPVKKKSNAIGPYDCTKFTNNLSSDPQ
nr:uncharacterized protein LOC113708555 [Coffea arabica]